MVCKPGFQECQHWLQQGERRAQILCALRQPMTARQIAKRANVARDACSRVFFELSLYGLVICLNPDSRTSRLYWLTPAGMKCRKALQRETPTNPPAFDFSTVDWKLYGWVCYRHRAAIIRALNRPMQPATVKRRACFVDPGLRMSANNTRDIMRLFLAREIVRPVRIGRRRHLRYELTETGKQLKRLLEQA